MNDEDYKKFYEKVVKRIGWDFSKVKSTSEGEKWDFYEVVVKKAKPTDKLLDIGTGGGKKVLAIADSFSSIVGIDHTKSMIRTANKNLKNSGAKNVEFKLMDADNLEFPKESFDFVTSRHCNFYPKEVYKVLKKNGYFMTQQVSEADKLNVKIAFGRGQAFGVKDGTLKSRYLKELKEAGFKNIKSDDYNKTVYYKTPEDLIFILKYTPIIRNFGESKEDFEILEKFIEENMTENGIKTNSKRFMISARK